MRFLKTFGSTATPGTVYVDPILLGQVFFAIVASLHIVTFAEKDQLTAIKMILLVLFGLSGIILPAFFGVKVEPVSSISPGQLRTLAILGATTFSTLILTQTLTISTTRGFLGLSATPTQIVTGAIASGVLEELFFRHWMTSTLYKYTHQYGVWPTIATTASLFMYYHQMYYGSDIPLLIAVGICGLELGYMQILFGRVSIEATGHTSSNLLVSLIQIAKMLK